ncbi:MAG TPA: hypothetical protein VHG89_13045 [Verrucomicrobiae bacterium]|nr:hypothetical protein [Verrucomicrobiae bacterium]
MNYWKIILATIVIFGAGVLTGGLLVNHVDRAHFEGHRPPSENHDNHDNDLPMPRGEMQNKAFVQQLDSELHLTPEQHKAIEKILADGQQRNRDLWKLVSPQFRSVMQDVHQKIREKLTPEQRKQFEQLLKQFHPPRRPPETTNAPTPATTNSPAN